MLHLILDAAGAVILYVIGVAHGLSHNATVDKAIAFIQSAEAKAKSVLADIEAHKAS